MRKFNIYFYASLVSALLVCGRDVNQYVFMALWINYFVALTIKILSVK